MRAHDISDSVGISAAEFRILIVGAHNPMTHLVLTTMAGAGFDCRYALDAVTALNSLRDIYPHLALLMMSLEENASIAAEARLIADIPLIAIGTEARGDKSVSPPLFRIEVSDRISEPLDVSQLLVHVVRHVRHVLGSPVIADLSGAPIWLPPGWAGCEVCRFTAPVQHFDAHDKNGLRVLSCPECYKRGNLTFAVSRAHF